MITGHCRSDTGAAVVRDRFCGRKLRKGAASFARAKRSLTETPLRQLWNRPMFVP